MTHSARSPAIRPGSGAFSLDPPIIRGGEAPRESVDPGFRRGLGDRKAAHRVTRHDARVIDLPDVFAGLLMLLTVALFAAMIWAGNHRH